MYSTANLITTGLSPETSLILTQIIHQVVELHLCRGVVPGVCVCVVCVCVCVLGTVDLIPNSFPVPEPDSLTPPTLVFVGIAILVIYVPV